MTTYQKLKNKNQELLEDIKILTNTDKTSIKYVETELKYKFLFDSELQIMAGNFTGFKNIHI